MPILSDKKQDQQLTGNQVAASPIDEDWTMAEVDSSVHAIHERLADLDKRFETLATKDQIKEFRDGLEKYLAEMFPDVMKGIVRDHARHSALDGETRERADMSAMLERLRGQNDELVAKNKSLEDLVESHNGTITSLRKEAAANVKELSDAGLETKAKLAQTSTTLRQKMRDNQRLHEIIIQSGQDDSQRSDEDLVKDFTELNSAIERLVKRHLRGARAKTGWVAFDNLRASDDRELFLQAYIADEISEELFVSSARLFGLEDRPERHQAEFEKMLVERKVPQAELVKWRVQTIKVASLMAHGEREYRYDRIFSTLCKKLEDVHHPTVSDKVDWGNTRNEIAALCKKAWELALSLRGSKTSYQWCQNAKPSSIDESDVDSFGPYNPRSKTASHRPVKVLFGPFYKRVEGELTLLRKGVVLHD